MLWTSPIYKQVKTVAKGGFTGKKRDARGYNICYQNGKRVPCNALGEGKKKPASKKPAKKPIEQSVKEIRDLVESGQGTPEKLLGLISGHTIPELKKIQAELGLSIKGNPAKAKRTDAIAQGALALMKGKEEPEPTPEPEPEDIKGDEPNEESALPKPDASAFKMDRDGMEFEDFKKMMPEGLTEDELKRGLERLNDAGKFRVGVDPKSGDIYELRPWRIGNNLVEVTKEDIDKAFIPSLARQISSNKTIQQRLKSLASLPVPEEEVRKASLKLEAEIKATMARAKKVKDRKAKSKLISHANSLHAKKYEELVSGTRKRTEEMRNKLVEAIKVDNPARVNIKYEASVTSPVYKERASEAVDFLSKVLAKGEGGSDFDANMRQADGRAFYNIKSNSVNCDPSDGVGTFVHELSHGIEERMPGAHQACLDFLSERVKNEKPTNFREKFGDGYRENESGRKDDFAKAFGDSLGAESSGYYVGKDYGNAATEVLSMGVELLYRDPSGFAKRDPEYCGFVLGILDGSLRSKKKPSDDSATPIDIDRED